MHLYSLNSLISTVIVCGIIFPCLHAMQQVKIAMLSSSISASARDYGRRTLFYIEICTGIDELKPNKYVGTKKGSYSNIGLGIASELTKFYTSAISVACTDHLDFICELFCNRQ